MDRIARTSNDFGFRLHRVLGATSNHSDNLVCSPLSISLTLAVLFVGARGSTAQQIERAMRWSGLNRSSLAYSFGRFLKYQTTKQSSETANFSLLNRVWVEREFAIKSEYRHALTYDFGSEVGPFDAPDTLAAPFIMGRWMALRSFGQLNLIPEKIRIYRQAKLVVTSGIYFKGFWASPLVMSPGSRQPFYSTTEEITNVEMMRSQSMMKLVGDPHRNSFVLEMPYQDGIFSLLVVLPERGVELINVERKLSDSVLQAWLSALRRLPPRLVDLTLPKFTLSSDVKLEDMLSPLRMNLLRDPLSTNMSGISTKPGLRLSHIFHHAVFELNEEGTTISSSVASLHAQTRGTPSNFTVDRPFLLILINRESNIVLLTCRVTRPSSS